MSRVFVVRFFWHLWTEIGMKTAGRSQQFEFSGTSVLEDPAHPLHRTEKKKTSISPRSCGEISRWEGWWLGLSLYAHRINGDGILWYINLHGKLVGKCTIL